MAANLTVRDVPDQVVAGLRERARRNGRSMQKEVLAILQGAVLDRGSLVEQLSSLRERVGAHMTLDQINEAIDEGRS